MCLNGARLFFDVRDGRVVGTVRDVPRARAGKSISCCCDISIAATEITESIRTPDTSKQL